MQDDTVIPQRSNQGASPSPKLQNKRINDLNHALIQAENGEIKLSLDQILSSVMEIIYFRALDEGERPVVDLDIARVYKRGFLAADKCGFNTKDHQPIIDFFLRGFQIHINRYIQSQQKEFSQTLDIS